MASLTRSYAAVAAAQTSGLPHAEPTQSASRDSSAALAACYSPTFGGLTQTARLGSRRLRHGEGRQQQRARSLSVAIRMGLMGADPEWSDDDYIVLGVAHCFVKEESKLSDVFVIEPIPAGAVECMDNGGVTCFKHAIGTRLGTALRQDAALLPPEFHGAKFCEDFDFRTKCASRTWKRQHAVDVITKLMGEGKVRSDWNFGLEDKRVLNMDYEPSDADNIKQDMSIDVYGRAEGEEEPAKEAAIEQLYNA